MRSAEKVVVIGLGEIGRPLLTLLSEHYDVTGVDIEPAENVGPVEFMHICYPFGITDFFGETARYIGLFRPGLTIINSTVSVGTTRDVAERTGAAVVNSPVRGKHARMLEDLRLYTKFIGATNPIAADRAARHFASAGLKTQILSSPEATELAKLSETTYFGLMIAWAQEVERFCDQSGQDYREVVSFYREIKAFPPVEYVSGIIGGHCVLPNIEILSSWHNSLILEAIRDSNNKKIDREAHSGVGMAAT